MTNTYFCLSAVVLIYSPKSYLSVCLTSARDFNCNGNVLNANFVYDCRYSLRLQQTFFNQFLQKFRPLKWIISNKKNIRGDVPFKISQMTYMKSNLHAFQTLTNDNFDLTKFMSGTLKTKQNSCPRHLPMNALISDTRNDLGKTVYTAVRKLAIFVIAENIVEGQDDDVVLGRLVSDQMSNDDVERVFVVIRRNVKLSTTDDMFLYADSLDNSFEVVKKLIWLICNSCYRTFEGLTQYSSCYNFVYDYNITLVTITSKDAEQICNVKWAGSHLAYINSQREFDYLVSDQGIVNIFTIHEDRMFEKWPGRQNRNKKFINGLYEIDLVGFIGLSSKSSDTTGEYTWNDGTPLVIDPPWGSIKEGKGCVYMSLKYSLKGKVATRERLHWHELDCNQTVITNFTLCESEIFNEGELLLHLNAWKLTSQESNSSFVSTSYLNLLYNQIHNTTQNAMMTSFKHKVQYNVTHQQCKIKCNAPDDKHVNVTRLVTPGNIFLQLIQGKRRTCKQYPHNNSSFLLIGSFDDCREIRNNEDISKVFDNSQLHLEYLNYQIYNVSECLYQTDSDRHRIEFYDKSYLQKCEEFVCPSGYVKCPYSYCIPTYLLHDDVKDCPHGEDEMSVNEIKLCTRNFKFTLKNLCLKNEITEGIYLNITSEFICEVPCQHYYFCVSNIIRKMVENETTMHVSYIETTVRLYEELGLFKFTPQIYSLFVFNKLVDLDLNNCKISDFNDVIKSIDISKVQILDVSNNAIAGIRQFSLIQEINDLKILNMSFNKNLELDENFVFPSNLQVVDLSHTNCGLGVIHALVYLTHLKLLVLSHINPIDLSLTGSLQLDILDVRGTKLVNIKYGYLSWLSIEEGLYSDDYRICCDVIRGPFIPNAKCHAPRDAISTCKDLIGNPLKRFTLWLVGVLSFIGNMAVVIYRLTWERSVLKKAYGIYVVYLGVSDFIMGAYLILIAGADTLYRNTYVLSDSKWRNSYICKLAGIMSTFSSETSTMFICLITLDRFLVIRYPFGEHRISKTGKKVSLCLTLIIGAIVSFVPALFVNWEIYSYTGMCLALPFSSGSYMGWEFSVFLFIGLNLILFILIAIGQIAIFLSLLEYKKNLSNVKTDDLRRAQESAIARQLFSVALSDFFCWFPIGIMGILSLTGFQFSLEVYAWTAILILPVNSAINPIIYTLPAVWKKIK